MDMRELKRFQTLLAERTVDERETLDVIRHGGRVTYHPAAIESTLNGFFYPRDSAVSRAISGLVQIEALIPLPVTTEEVATWKGFIPYRLSDIGANICAAMVREKERLHSSP